MRNIKYITGVLCLLAALTSCEVDNYPGPKETFRGKFIDKATGEPFQTAVGDKGVRIRMMEYSWSENPQPYDFYCKVDGTFNNTKIFKGRYGIRPEGAFVPLEEEIMEISGTVDKIYEVEPLLKVEWVGEQVVNADGTVDVTVTVERGTSDAGYQQNLNEIWLFVSEISYVFDGYHSPVLSTKLTGGSLPALDAQFTIQSGYPDGQGVGNRRLFPAYSRKYFLRVGARTDLSIMGQKIFNYSTVKEITTIPR